MGAETPMAGCWLDRILRAGPKALIIDFVRSQGRV
jgi:hypothetical protein